MTAIFPLRQGRFAKIAAGKGAQKRKRGISDGCTPAYRRDRAADLCPMGDLQRCQPGPGKAGAAGPHPPRVPAGPGPRAPLQGVPAAQAEDAGLPLAGRRPLPHPADAYAGSFADRPHHCPRPAAERGPDRSHQSGPRPWAHSLRPRGRKRAGQALPGRLQALPPESAGRG